MGLDGSTCLECLDMVTCDLEPPEHDGRRTWARAHNDAVVVFGRAPCVPRRREYEKRPATGRQTNTDVPKSHLYILIYRYIGNPPISGRYVLSQHTQHTLKQYTQYRTRTGLWHATYCCTPITNKEY